MEKHMQTWRYKWIRHICYSISERSCMHIYVHTYAHTLIHIYIFYISRVYRREQIYNLHMTRWLSLHFNLILGLNLQPPDGGNSSIYKFSHISTPHARVTAYKTALTWGQGVTGDEIGFNTLRLIFIIHALFQVNPCIGKRTSTTDETRILRAFVLS